MKFNHTPIFTGLVAVIRDEVGSSLAQVAGPAGTTVPAVYQDRQRQYKTYPYITVDRLSTRTVDGWLKNASVNANNNVEYTYEYQSLYLITAYGEDADEILTHLKQKFSFERVREKLYTASGNLAVFQRSRDVVESPVLYETDYEPQASMEITINFEATLADTDSTIIDSAQITGNLKDTDDDSTPITNTINVP